MDSSAPISCCLRVASGGINSDTCRLPCKETEQTLMTLEKASSREAESPLRWEAGRLSPTAAGELKVLVWTGVRHQQHLLQCPSSDLSPHQRRFQVCHRSINLFLHPYFQSPFLYDASTFCVSLGTSLCISFFICKMGMILVPVVDYKNVYYDSLLLWHPCPSQNNSAAPLFKRWSLYPIPWI